MTCFMFGKPSGSSYWMGRYDSLPGCIRESAVIGSIGMGFLETRRRLACLLLGLWSRGGALDGDTLGGTLNKSVGTG